MPDKIAILPHCSFCHRPKSEVELLFGSDARGSGAWVCLGCAVGFTAIGETHRESPDLAEELVAAINAVCGR